MLSSTELRYLLSNILGENISKALRAVVETSSVIYNWGDEATFSHYSSSDLWSIRSFAGSQVLQELDTVVSNSKLAKASRDELKATFLVLFGMVVAVGYTGSSSQSNRVSRSVFTTQLL